MRLSRASPAVFGDPNLVPGSRWPRCGLGALAAGKPTLKAEGGCNARVMVPALVAGMAAGADSIDDVDLLLHGRMRQLFEGH